MEIESIPLFPPWCVVHPAKQVCTAFGISIPCAALPANDDIFGQEVSIGHWMTTISLFGIGIINLIYLEAFPPHRKDTMKIITGLYAIITASFSFCRLYFGISRFTLMAAAGHNLPELCMLAVVSYGSSSTKIIEHKFKIIFMYIYLICVFVVMFPSLIIVAVFEQFAGIIVDYTLAIVFVYTYVTSADDEVKKFYKLPAMAHGVHLIFTILPLVFSNFHIGHTTWYNSFYLETAIYMSAPFSHLMYMLWSHEVDDLRKIGEKDQTGIVPTKYRLNNLIHFVSIGFVCGLITVVGFPLALGPCPS